MKEVFNKKKEIIGYGIGEYIRVHKNIHNPDNWVLTIPPLKIYGDTLGPLSLDTKQISKRIIDILNSYSNTVLMLQQDVEGIKTE